MGRTLIIFFRSSRALRPLEKSEVEMEHISSAYGEVVSILKYADMTSIREY